MVAIINCVLPISGMPLHEKSAQKARRDAYLAFKGMVKHFMTKLGLLFEVLGFLMMFWHSVWRPSRNIEVGSGVVFKYILSKKLRHWIIDRFLGIAFLLMGIGVILMLI